MPIPSNNIEKINSISLPDGYVLNNAYLIRKTLGQGGFGITYLAEEDITGRSVVIKENFPTFCSQRNRDTLNVTANSSSQIENHDWALACFLNEARILARLNHPHIVPVTAAFRALNTAYYVMPHIDGTPLHLAAPEPDKITEAWLTALLGKLLNALQYLHSQQMLHRDIKPANILISTSGEPIIIDFGTARSIENTHTQTKMGTPGYAPLEQWSVGGKRGPWTDLYALGATFYYLLTGTTPPDCHERADEDNYQSLSKIKKLTTRFSPRILAGIDKALNMQRRERWQSAREWLAALQDTTAPTTLPAPPKPPAPPNLSAPPTKKKLIPQKTQRHAKIYTKQYETELQMAAVNGNVQRLRELISIGVDIDKCNKFGYTPLYHAVWNGHSQCVKLLAQAGADVNRACQYGWVPLHAAARSGHIDCVKVLLAAGADTNVKDLNGMTPLNIAAAYGHQPICALLKNTCGK